jgi:outer membrane immunogenic protein
MNKFLLLSSLALSAIIPTAAAIAADLDLPPPPPPVEELRPATYDWTGFYAGGWVGTACIDGTLKDVQSGPPITTTTYLNSGCGYKGGIMAGYNHQIDNIVFGVEGDWGMSNDIVHNIDPTADFRFKLDSIATLRGRLGYAVDDTLFYVTAGGAYAQGEYNGIIWPVPSGLKADQFGWAAGLGIEHAFTDNVRFRLEGIYTSMQDGTYTSGTCGCNLTNHWGNEWETKAGVVWAF